MTHICMYIHIYVYITVCVCVCACVCACCFGGGLLIYIVHVRIFLDQAFDSCTTLVDACFYNQLEILNGCIKHSGDERDGNKEGFDEVCAFQFNS